MKEARILIVDDDDDVRGALVDELSASYTVEAVSSGSEAFDALATQQYDVVISDLKMPDHDGIEVLEFARNQQSDAVRVLLTGYLDERAQQALMSPHAPYKVGKPWHDEIEVVVRRGLEQREFARRLTASVQDALSMSAFDDELAKTESISDLGTTVVRRALAVEGVTSAVAVTRSSDDGGSEVGSEVRDRSGWRVDLPLDAEGELRLQARGTTEAARQLISYMAHRAQRRCGVLEARVQALSSNGGGNRVNRLMRQATVGAMTASLLHDLASMMQSLSAALCDIMSTAGEVPGLRDAVFDVCMAGDEAFQLFVQTRKFIRGSEVACKPVPAKKVVEGAVRGIGGVVRERCRLEVGEVADVAVSINEPLFLQVMINLLRNAAKVSPPNGVVDIQVATSGTEVTFSVCDDGPGVSEELGEVIFDPFASGPLENKGLSLAISAYIMELLQGRLNYRRMPGRGACFSAVLPIHTLRPDANLKEQHSQAP